MTASERIRTLREQERKAQEIARSGKFPAGLNAEEPNHLFKGLSARLLETREESRPQRFMIERQNRAGNWCRVFGPLKATSPEAAIEYFSTQAYPDGLPATHRVLRAVKF